MRYLRPRCPRPALYPVKKIIGFDEKMVAAVEKVAGQELALPTFSEAIRRLVELGLKAKSGRKRDSPIFDFAPLVVR